MKKIFIILLFSLIFANIFAEQYQIQEVEYDIIGRTKEHALNQKLNINKKQIFNTLEELETYIGYINQSLVNQRVLQETSIKYELGTLQENNIIPVKIIITAKDTWNIFPVPYPKYNSNNGFEFKLKIKDYNFFGSMEIMNFDLVFFQENEGENNNIGLGIDFSIPFGLGMFNAMWNVDTNIAYTFGNNKPDFDFSTGLDFSLPLNFVTFQLSIKQSITQNTDYTDINDDFYLSEYISLAAPFTLLSTTSYLGDIKLTPNIEFNYNWDIDKIVHEDLIGPTLNLGYNFSFGKVDWVGNFRKGFFTDISQDFTYNFSKEKWNNLLSTELRGYFSRNFISFNGRFYGFTTYNPIKKDFSSKIEIGSRMRGIFDSSDLDNNQGQLETSAALCLNIDIPIKIVQTDWRKWGKNIFNRNMPNWFAYLDFEMQISPFIDVALTNNTITKRLFNPKDGFYGAGLEVLVFPSKMRSIQVRGCIGLDLSSKLPVFDAPWRTSKGPEIEIGIGLHY